MEENLIDKLKEKATGGDPIKQYELGVFYSDKKEFDKALLWYRRSAEQGYEGGFNGLGFCYQKGICVPKNEQKAFVLFKEAADKGFVKAIYNLAVCYLYGMGVEKNAAKAIDLLREAANKGYVVAQSKLGFNLLSGPGVERNPKEAFKWLSIAAENGNAIAEYNLGDMYLTGDAGTKDLGKAVALFERAAAKNCAQAKWALGNCYYFGNGVEQNFGKAVTWYTKAANDGDYYAQCELGECYYNGKGIKQDKRKAVVWFTKAAEQGHVVACYNLGMCYFKGDGVERDVEKAFNWFHKAVLRNDTDSMQMLEKCVSAGAGSEKDINEIEEFYVTRFNQGDKYARKKLEELRFITCPITNLAQALFYANYDKVIEIVSDQKFNISVLTNELDGKYKNLYPCPLFYIPLLVKTVCRMDIVEYYALSIKDVRMDIATLMELSDKRRVDNEKIIAFLSKKFGLDYSISVPYSKYVKYFSQTCTKFPRPINSLSKITNTNCRDIDVQLYSAGIGFEFGNMEELLKSGASSDAHILDDNGYEYSMSDIFEGNFYASCAPNPLWSNGRPLKSIDIPNLIYWAATEEEYDLLEMYHQAPKRFTLQEQLKKYITGIRRIGVNVTQYQTQNIEHLRKYIKEQRPYCASEMERQTAEIQLAVAHQKDNIAKSHSLKDILDKKCSEEVESKEVSNDEAYQCNRYRDDTASLIPETIGMAIATGIWPKKTRKEFTKLVKSISKGLVTLRCFNPEVVQFNTIGNDVLLSATTLMSIIQEQDIDGMEQSLLERVMDREKNGPNQERILEAWARSESLWINDYTDVQGDKYASLEDYLHKNYTQSQYGGSEADVYWTNDKITVIKSLSLSHSDNNPQMLLNRIMLYNAYFPTMKLTVKGFGRDVLGHFQTIVSQNFISGTYPTQQEINTFAVQIGFNKHGGWWYSYDNIFRITDLSSLNVIKTDINELAVIDCDFEMLKMNKGLARFI